MKLAIIGAGYVGLVSAACFADFGHDVVCVDSDAGKIDALNQSEIPIYEPGLEQLVQQNSVAGRLRFTMDLDAAVAGVDAIFIAVGTPARRGDGHADLDFVRAAVRSVALAANAEAVIITKSTVPVGTGDEIAGICRDVAPAKELHIASNPEFLREGAAIEDFKRPDRIVVGAESDHARDVLAAIYRPLYLNKAPILYTSRRSAELIKYAANAFLATKISFINEIADLCEATGGEVQDVARGIGLDNRIGSKFLHAGPGYGGSCFPKDTKALLRTAEDCGVPLKIVTAADAVNTERKTAMARRISDIMGGELAGKTIAILGLTFKPNTDDLREAPALEIIFQLQSLGAHIQAYDPVGMAGAEAVTQNVRFCESVYAAAENADALVLITEWDAFRALDFARLKAAMAEPLFFDLRNVYHRHEVEAFGFAYHSIGRPV